MWWHINRGQRTGTDTKRVTQTCDGPHAGHLGTRASGYFDLPSGRRRGYPSTTFLNPWYFCWLSVDNPRVSDVPNQICFLWCPSDGYRPGRPLRVHVRATPTGISKRYCARNFLFIFFVVVVEGRNPFEVWVYSSGTFWGTPHCIPEQSSRLSLIPRVPNLVFSRSPKSPVNQWIN